METAATGDAPGEAALEVLRANAALLREQISLARNERFRNRIMAIRDTAMAALVIVLIAAAGAAVWTASRTTGLVIQPFSVPPKLAEDGLDGRAVAALFQDELVRLEAATLSARPASSFRNDWSEAITVEIEAGGLSLTDAYRALTRWLGRETYLSGGLSRSQAGLDVVVRTSDGVVIRMQGPADQPAELMRRAAERIYEETQPYRYSVYLRTRGFALPQGPERQALIDRSRDILTKLLASPSETERVWAYNGLSVNDAGGLSGAVSILEAALQVDPNHPVLLVNIMEQTRGLSHDEASLAYARRSLAALADPRHRIKVSEERQKTFPVLATAIEAGFVGDWQLAERRYEEFANTSLLWRVEEFRDSRDLALIALHQVPDPLKRVEAVALERARRVGPRRAQYDLLRAATAASFDNWTEALKALEASVDLVNQSASPGGATDASLGVLNRPRLAYARARTGDLAGAQAVINATPLDCYLCIRERARIAELAGDRAAADRWSAEARRQGPSLPFAFAERGQMLAARGDLTGAIDFYKEATQRGPRWADPQKYWGDALMAQGDAAGAIRRYRAAAERAPKWGALHLAWGRALEARGRQDQAREKYAEAARMDLSDADRAEVVRRLRPRG